MKKIPKYISLKENISRKSRYQQKVLKFKKTSPFSQNWFIEGMLLNESAVYVYSLIGHYLISKRFHSERIQNNTNEYP